MRPSGSWAHRSTLGIQPQSEVGDVMARHYYWTNVPLPVMILWWIFLGICIVCYSCYNALVNGPKEKAQAQWDRDHFNGWRLEKSYDDAHGLMFDKLDKKTCTTKAYPGYEPCPAQQYFGDGKPQSAPPK
jgi:hypothetical protein